MTLIKTSFNKILRSPLFALCMLTSFSVIASTDHWFYKAVIAWDNQEFHKARILFNRSAQLGNAEACYNLGVIYQQGIAVHANSRRATLWFTRAAQGGNSKAQFVLAKLIIAQTRKSNRDIRQAKRWLFKAAHQKHPAAMYWLGTLYTMGQGVKISHTKAAYWYIKAARAGHATAQLHSARLYSRGIGVKKNIITAYAWAKLATLQRASRARQNWLYIQKPMTIQQRRRGDLLAKQLAKHYTKPSLKQR